MVGLLINPPHIKIIYFPCIEKRTKTSPPTCFNPIAFGSMRHVETELEFECHMITVTCEVNENVK